MQCDILSKGYKPLHFVSFGNNFEMFLMLAPTSSLTFSGCHNFPIKFRLSQAAHKTV